MHLVEKSTMSQAKSELEWSAEELRRAVKSAGVALWTWDVNDDTFIMDAKAYELWDIPEEEDLTFEHLSAKVHPADRDRVRASFVATRAIDGPFEIDFRIMTGASDVRWVSARGQGNEGDAATRKMTGIFLDVTGRKQAEEGHELLAGEMSHRVKNLLALAAGLTNITSRSTDTKEEMALQLTQRLTALGRAHELVRPLPDAQGAQRCWAISSLCCSRLMTTSARSPVASASRSHGWDWAKKQRPASRSSSMNWQQIR